MLVALGGVLGSYNGSFDFSKPGAPYPDDVPYAFMRIVRVLLMPFAYS